MCCLHFDINDARSKQVWFFKIFEFIHLKHTVVLTVLEYSSQSVIIDTFSQVFSFFKK